MRTSPSHGNLRTATSGPGISLMAEYAGLGYAAELPGVIWNVQRVGPSTGLPTQPSQGDVMQARWGSHGDYEIIALALFGVVIMGAAALRFRKRLD